LLETQVKLTCAPPQKDCEMQNSTQKIAVLIDRLGSGAGGEASLLDFVLALGSSGHLVHVLVARSSASQRRQLRRLIYAKGLTPGRIRVIPVARTLDFYVARSISLEDFVGLDAPRLTAARFLLLPARQKIKDCLREADIIIASQVLSNHGLRQVKNLAKKAKLVLSHNGDPQTFSEKWERRERFGSDEQQTQYQQYLGGFDEILFQSTGQELEFRHNYPSIPSRLSTIWPSCDETKCLAAQNSTNPYDSDTFNFVYVAKFQPTKNQLELIEAFSQITSDFPRTTLTLVGGTISPQDYLDRCKSFVKQSGLEEKVLFTGHRHDSCRFIFHSDVVIHPSISEGVSRAIREAAFLGKPIVCSALTGLHSFLGRSGALYLTNSSADAIEDALRVSLAEKAMLEEISRVAYGAYSNKSEWARFERACVDLVKRLSESSIGTGDNL